VTCYAASSIGAVVTPVNPLSQDTEIVHQLHLARARWLVAVGELFAAKLDAAARAAGIDETFLAGAGTRAVPGATPFGQPASAGGATPRPGLALLMLPRWRRRAARPGCPSSSC
jgi:acyl-CoA synthetase (AMP-forming)/AMP-acid ligase II